MRCAGWALALAGPGLTAVVPVADGHTSAALFALAVFAAWAPLPSRRGQQWLRRRRPLVAVALRSAPILTLEASNAVRDPSHWLLLLIIAAVAVYAATMREVWWSHWRSEQTRRRLHARTQEIAYGGLPE